MDSESHLLIDIVNGLRSCCFNSRVVSLALKGTFLASREVWFVSTRNDI